MRLAILDVVVRPVLGFVGLLLLLFAAIDLVNGTWLLYSPAGWWSMQSDGLHSPPPTGLAGLGEGLVVAVAGAWLFWRACRPIFERRLPNPALERKPLAKQR